ncbi:hypothetical protein U0070_016570, partial [Myodes glareolus]
KSQGIHDSLPRKVSDIIPLRSLRIGQRARVRHIRRRLQASGPRTGAAIKCVGGRQWVSLCASLPPCCLLCILPASLAHCAEVVLQVLSCPVGRALRRGAGQDDPHLQTRVSDVSVTPPLELTQPGVPDPRQRDPRATMGFEDTYWPLPPEGRVSFEDHTETWFPHLDYELT